MMTIEEQIEYHCGYNVAAEDLAKLIVKNDWKTGTHSITYLNGAVDWFIDVIDKHDVTKRHSILLKAGWMDKFEVELRRARINAL